MSSSLSPQSILGKTAASLGVGFLSNCFDREVKASLPIAGPSCQD